MDCNHETTCIPHHFLYSIFDKYCANFKPLFLAKSTNFHLFPYNCLTKHSIGRPYIHSFQAINIHALPVSITKSWEVQFSNQLLVMLHRVFAKCNTSSIITIFVNLGLFRQTITNIRTWIKSHRYERML